MNYKSRYRPGRSRVGDLGKKTAGAAPLHKRNVTALKTCKVGPGASVVLAESLASIAATYCIDRERFMCLGQEINANHLVRMRHGLATGTARPFHIGARSQVWGVEITDESGRLACVSRVTMAVVERRRSAQDAPRGARS